MTKKEGGVVLEIKSLIKMFESLGFYDKSIKMLNLQELIVLQF